MTPMFAGSGMFMLLVMVAVFLLLSTLMQRPLKKQAAAQAELRRSVTEGNRILLTSGIFATVTHVGDQQLICEVAPGVEVTVLKDAVKSVVTADDEEFEYADLDTPEPGNGLVPEVPVAEVPVAGGPVAEGPVADRVVARDEPTSDAAAMSSAAPGTEESLGMPAPADLPLDAGRPAGR